MEVFTNPQNYCTGTDPGVYPFQQAQSYAVQPPPMQYQAVQPQPVMQYQGASPLMVSQHISHQPPQTSRIPHIPQPQTHTLAGPVGQQAAHQSSQMQHMQQLHYMRQIQLMQQQRQMQLNPATPAAVKQSFLEENKSDIFSAHEHDTGNSIYYGENTITNLSLENTNKKYFKRLYALNIPTVVKSKVEEYIVSTAQRIHVIDDEVLCAKVINAYHELGIPYDEYELFEMFGIDPRKTKVHEYTSNTSTRNSAIVEAPISISLSVTEPSKYVPVVLDNYVMKHQIPIENLDLMKQRVVNLCKLLCRFNKLLFEEQPYNIAAAFVFLFIKEMTNVTVKKSDFSQKIFSELPNVDTKKFSKVYKIVLETFNTLKHNRPDILSSYFSTNYS